jgi:hypothetical protein
MIPCFCTSGFSRTLGDVEHDFPRLAAIYAPSRLESIKGAVDSLSAFDVLTLSVNVGQRYPDVLKELKKKNPKLVLLVYMNSQGIAMMPVNEKETKRSPLLREALFAGIKNEWWVRDVKGDIIPALASKGGRVGLLNVTDTCTEVDGQRWNTYLIDFIEERVFSTGLWNGVMFDVVKDDVFSPFLIKKQKRHGGDKPLKPPGQKLPPDAPAGGEKLMIDLNRDGKIDDFEWVNKKWREGYRQMFTYARKRFDPSRVIVANGDHTYYEYVNGKIFENFPHFIPSTRGDWKNTVTLYQSWVERAQSPKIVIFDLWCPAKEYQRMRFALTSCLMDDGYFSHESGDRDKKRKGEILWYDEYDNAGKGTGYLGKPQGKRRTVKNDVSRRDFENGIVLCNLSDSSAEIRLEKQYRKIKGAQAPKVNDGSIVSTVVLPPKDGIILLKHEGSKTCSH